MTGLAGIAVATVVLALVAGIEASTLAQAVTAAVGFFVAYQAYRGYRRNDSRPMLFLGVGIVFITTVSFVVSTLVVSPLGASEGVTVLSWVAANVVGLAAIFYAFTGASRGRREDTGRRPRDDPDRPSGDRRPRGGQNSPDRPSGDGDRRPRGGPDQPSGDDSGRSPEEGER